MPGHFTADNGQRRNNAYISGPNNSMKNNDYSKNKYYQSRGDKYNGYKHSININDPIDWPTLGAAETQLTSNGINSNENKLRNGLESNGPTVFSKKKIVQTKNTTSNGEIVETTTIEETDTFSKLVISKEPTNKDSNNNRILNTLNDESLNGSTSSQLDDSLDNSDDKDKSETNSNSSSTEKKVASSTTTEQSQDEQNDKSNKNKKKNSKSKWKILEIEQPPSRPLIIETTKRKFDRRDRDHHREHFRDQRNYRDSRMSIKRKEYNNSNGKYGDNYYGNRNKYSNNYSNNHNSSSNHQSKDSHINNSNNLTSANNNAENESINKLSNNTKSNSKSSTTETSSTTTTKKETTTSTTTNSQQTNGDKNQLQNGNSYSNGLSNHHRQKRISGGNGGRLMRNSRSVSSNYRQYKNKMHYDHHYDSGNVTPSDYDCNGYYLENVQQSTQVQLTNATPTNSYMAPAYYIAPNYPQIHAPARTGKWPNLEESLRNQIEYYFSDENLQRDFFLRRKMDKEGYLPISLIASFYRVKAMTLDQDSTLIIESLKKSSKLELSDDNKRVRSKNEPLKWPLLDQIQYPINQFEFNKAGSNSSSCNSKDTLSSDSANDSRTSGVSFNSFTSSGTTDLHPNVPEFIPGQPYGYLYDGANNSPYIYYQQASFQKSPMENTYTLTNYPLSYNTIYPLNSTTTSTNLIEQQCTEENSKTEDNTINDNDNEIKNETITEKLDNLKIEDEEEKLIEIKNENEEPQEDDFSPIKKQSNDKKSTEVNEQNKENNSQIVNCTNDNNSKIIKNEELNANKNINNSKITNSSSNNLEKSSISNSNKENSSASLIKNTTTNSSSSPIPPKPIQAPAKILSYSDAIKFISNKPSPQTEESTKSSSPQIKTDESTNKLTESKDNKIENNLKENQTENRKDNKKSNDKDNKRSKDFHGFNKKSKNRSSVRK